MLRPSWSLMIDPGIPSNSLLRGISREMCLLYTDQCKEGLYTFVLGVPLFSFRGFKATNASMLFDRYLGYPSSCMTKSKSRPMEGLGI